MYRLLRRIYAIFAHVVPNTAMSPEQYSIVQRHSRLLGLISVAQKVAKYCIYTPPQPVHDFFFLIYVVILSGNIPQFY